MGHEQLDFNNEMYSEAKKKMIKEEFHFANPSDLTGEKQKELKELEGPVEEIDFKLRDEEITLEETDRLTTEREKYLNTDNRRHRIHHLKRELGIPY